MHQNLNLTKLRENVKFDKTVPIRPYWNTEADSYSVHWQPNIEVIFPVENIYTVTVDGYVIELHEGDLLLISPGALHSIQAPPSGCRYILQFLPRLFTHIEGLDNLTSMFYPYILFDSSADNSLRKKLSDIMDSVYEHYYGSENCSTASVYADILELIITIARNRQVIPSAAFHERSFASHKYADKFLDICDYIREHCTEQLSVSELADKCGFSESHFLRLFRECTDMSYNDYLNNCRITYAKKLLADDSRKNITEVYMQSGFGSLATFNRLFKAYVSCTPSAFRDKLRTPID